MEADGEQADTATGGQRFVVVLCHGVLMYLERPEPIVHALCRCVQPGVVSVGALNAKTLAIRPALERRWSEALTAFDATHEVGVLGTDTRGDTVEGLSEVLQRNAVEPKPGTGSGCSLTGWTCRWRPPMWRRWPKSNFRPACASPTASSAVCST